MTSEWIKAFTDKRRGAPVKLNAAPYVSGLPEQADLDLEQEDPPYLQDKSDDRKSYREWLDERKTYPQRCQVSSTVRGQCTRFGHEDDAHVYDDLNPNSGRWSGNSPNHVCQFRRQVFGDAWEQCTLLGGHEDEHALATANQFGYVLPHIPPYKPTLASLETPDDAPAHDPVNHLGAGTAEHVQRADAEHDPVNAPRHYRAHPSGIETIQVTEWMNFCLGNATKYIWRADSKGGIEDLRKAVWYLEREIQRRARGGISS